MQYKFNETADDCDNYGTKKNVTPYDEDDMAKFWKMVKDKDIPFDSWYDFDKLMEAMLFFFNCTWALRGQNEPKI